MFLRLGSLGLLLGVFPLFGAACTSAPKAVQTAEYICGHRQFDVQFYRAHEALDTFSIMFEEQCYKEALDLGLRIREGYRDKVYSATSEVGEFFAAEGSLTPYILESHERIFLSLMLSAIYDRLENRDAAKVELRRAYDETMARVYNEGVDPVTLTLQATLWEKYGEPEIAAPFWRKAMEVAPKDRALRRFATHRVEQIDKGADIKPLDIYGFGKLPQINWSVGFGNPTPYTLQVNPEYFESCGTEKELALPNRTWSDQISNRYEKVNHPLTNVRSWTRIPVGLTYGVVVGTAGASLGIGCVALVGYASGHAEGTFQICKPAIHASIEAVKYSADLTNNVLRPDLRHWRQLPFGFYFVNSDDETTTARAPQCLGLADGPEMTAPTKLF